MANNSDDLFNKIETFLIRVTALTLLASTVVKLVWPDVEPLVEILRVFLGG